MYIHNTQTHTRAHAHAHTLTPTYNLTFSTHHTRTHEHVHTQYTDTYTPGYDLPFRVRFLIDSLAPSVDFAMNSSRHKLTRMHPHARTRVSMNNLIKTHMFSRVLGRTHGKHFVVKATMYYNDVTENPLCYHELPFINGYGCQLLNDGRRLR